MFTGLIEGIGELRLRRVTGSAGKLVVATELPLSEIELGDSIAVNGACLTVESINQARSEVAFHTLSETLERTNLGKLEPGSKLNLERAVRLGDRLGGHLVLGHVDATAAVRAVTRKRDDIVLRIALPGGLRQLLIDKGSVAVDGVSLTVVELEDEAFSIHLIPHSWQVTVLSEAVPGYQVNLEADMIGKYVLRAIRTGMVSDHGLNMKKLEQSGFST